MKYYLTLALCLLVFPAMAQKAKKSPPRKVVAKPAKSEVVAKVAGTPKLVMESLEHDFGKIKEGRPTSYSFLVKNEGTGVLQIENVAPS
jgi:hypothetical protein